MVAVMKSFFWGEESKNLLSVSPEEWKRAKHFFDKNPNQTKLRRNKENAEEQSFVKIGNKIYCLASSLCFDNAVLGEGKFSRVKIAQEEPPSGKMYAMKIEGRSLRTDQEVDHVISEVIGFAQGQAERLLDEPKLFKEELVDKKLYTLTEYIPAKELFDVLYEDIDQTLSAEQFLILILKTSSILLDLHRLGIIHSDIKENNFLANVDEMYILVSAIDFGLSKVIGADEQAVYLTRIQGTEGYIAPEIHDHGVYSFASDIYALGQMYKNIYNRAQEVVDSLEELLEELEFHTPVEQQEETHFDDILALKQSVAYHKQLVKSYEEKIYIPLNGLFSRMTAQDPKDRTSLEEIIESVLVQLNKVVTQLKEDGKLKEAEQIEEAVSQARSFLVDNHSASSKRKKILLRYEQANKLIQKNDSEAEEPEKEKEKEKKKGKEKEFEPILDVESDSDDFNTDQADSPPKKDNPRY